MTAAAIPAALPCRQDTPWIRAARAALKAEFGREAVLMGAGYSIPVVKSFKKYLKVDSLLTGFGLPDDNAHSPDEKYDVAAFRHGHPCLGPHLRAICRKVTDMTELNAVLDAATKDFDNSLERLFKLVRIPSISTDPAYAAECEKAANAIVDDLKGAGLQGAGAANAGPSHGGGALHPEGGDEEDAASAVLRPL